MYKLLDFALQKHAQGYRYSHWTALEQQDIAQAQYITAELQAYEATAEYVWSRVWAEMGEYCLDVMTAGHGQPCTYTLRTARSSVERT